MRVGANIRFIAGPYGEGGSDGGSISLGSANLLTPHPLKSLTVLLPPPPPPPLQTNIYCNTDEFSVRECCPPLRYTNVIIRVAACNVVL